MLIEMERDDIQPILFDNQNFQKKKHILFENEQLIRCMKKNKKLKDFREHPIGRTA